MRKIIVWKSALCILSIFFVAFDVLGGVENLSVENRPLSQQDISIMSLKRSKVHFRAGPGMQYPAKYSIECAHYPLMVIDEFQEWRKVSDYQGKIGWLKRSMLKIANYSIISLPYEDIPDLAIEYDVPKGCVIAMRLPRINSRPVAILQVGMIVNVKRCLHNWCQISFLTNSKRRINGWILQKSLWLPLPEQK